MTSDEIVEAFSRAVIAGAVRSWHQVGVCPTVYAVRLRDGSVQRYTVPEAVAFADAVYALEAVTR